VELPADPVIPRAVAPHSGSPGERSSSALPIGPGGDEGDVLTVDLARTGGLLVVGPPGSGRTAALEALCDRLRWDGVPVLRVGRGGLGVDDSGGHDREQWLHPSDVSGLDSWIAGLDGRQGVLVVDDLGPPAEEPAIAHLGGTEAAASVALLAAVGAGCLSSHYQGPVAALRRSRSGLLLCPGPGDADLMGVRLPRTPVPVRPGSGWLITGGAAERIQVARSRPRAGEDQVGSCQSSSSIGPISWVANQASS
jgi:S-DNA-T family DNA segregation ATPase FtsK/SpoIIIE